MQGLQVSVWCGECKNSRPQGFEGAATSLSSPVPPAAYPNPPVLAAAVPSPNTLPPVEPRGLVKAGAEPNAGTPPNPGDPPKVGGLPNTGAAPKPPEQNRGKQNRGEKETGREGIEQPETKSKEERGDMPSVTPTPEPKKPSSPTSTPQRHCLPLSEGSAALRSEHLLPS